MQLCYRGIRYEGIPSSSQFTQPQLEKTTLIFLKYRSHHYIFKPYVCAQAIKASSNFQDVNLVQKRLVYCGVAYVLRLPKMSVHSTLPTHLANVTKS